MSGLRMNVKRNKTVLKGRGTALNSAAFHQRFKGSGPYAARLAQRFQHSVKRLGLDKPKAALDLSQFKISAHSPSSLQMELF